MNNHYKLGKLEERKRIAQALQTLMEGVYKRSQSDELSSVDMTAILTLETALKIVLDMPPKDAA